MISCQFPRRELGSGSRQRSAFTDGIRCQLAESYGPHSQSHRIKMMLISFVSGVTFQRNLSNLVIWGCTGPVGRQNVAGDLRVGADVGEDSS